MAEIRSSVCVLEDSSTQAGLPLHKVAQGDAASGKNALAALVAKDPSGNLQYLKLDATNRLITTSSSADLAQLSDEGSNTGGSATFVDLASITLTPDASYKSPGLSVSCSRDAIFQLVQVDDATTSVLATMRVGQGEMTFAQLFSGIEFVAGSTGTQVLKIQGKNSNALSEMNSNLYVSEIQV